MPDPVTIGALVAAALSAGAVEIGKTALGGPAKDAYEGLKAMVARWAGPDVAALETTARDGKSTGRREAVVAEIVDERPEAERAEVRALAEALSNALEAEGRGRALGTTFNQFNAYDHATQYNAPGGVQNFGIAARRSEE